MATNSTGYINKDGKYIRSAPDASMKQHREHQGHREHVRVQMRRDHAADIVQPWVNGQPNPAFVDAQPGRAVDYFGEQRVNEIRRSL